MRDNLFTIGYQGRSVAQMIQTLHENETEPMKFEADSGQDSVLILREYMRNHSRRKTHQNQIVKEVLLTDNMTDKKKIIQKALRLARNGERLGFLTDTGLGDYTLKPVRSDDYWQRLHDAGFYDDTSDRIVDKYVRKIYRLLEQQNTAD